MEAFEYAHPTTQHEAIGLLGSSWNDAAVLAGGTDLISLMKEYVVTPKRVVNIKNVEGLNGIQSNAEGLRIGALVTMDELLDNATIRSEFPALTQAAGGITSPQIRSVGTVGGDLCRKVTRSQWRKSLPRHPRQQRTGLLRESVESCARAHST